MRSGGKSGGGLSVEGRNKGVEMDIYERES